MVIAHMHTRASDPRSPSDAQVILRGLHLTFGSDARWVCGGVHLRERERVSISLPGTYVRCTPPHATCASDPQTEVRCATWPGSDAHMHTCPTGGHLTSRMMPGLAIPAGPHAATTRHRRHVEAAAGERHVPRLHYPAPTNTLHPPGVGVKGGLPASPKPHGPPTSDSVTPAIASLTQQEHQDAT
jgi:hypothetical protein